MMVHTLKTWPDFFEPLFSGIKTFELRINDRHHAYPGCHTQTLRPTTARGNE
jgi:hypothetical protein